MGNTIAITGQLECGADGNAGTNSGHGEEKRCNVFEFAMLNTAAA